MIKQKTICKLYQGNDPHAFFGPGPYQLFQYIDETRSIAKAARRMNMAYTKALSMIKRAETAMSQPLITAQTGGKGGGGSELTDTAKSLLTAFSACQSALDEKSEALYKAHLAPIIK